MPSITTCTFLTLTNSFKLFDQNLALTGGLPSVIQNGAKFNQTELLALNIYSTYNINKNWHGVARQRLLSSLFWWPFWPLPSRPRPAARRCSSDA